MNEDNNASNIPVVNNDNDPRQRLYNQGTYPTLSKNSHTSYILNDITTINTDLYLDKTIIRTYCTAI